MLSIIIPAYNEESNILIVVKHIEATLKSTGYNWEIILVDDGSTDDTYQVIRDAVCANPRLRALRFSRNFGSHAAISAGLQHVVGDAAIVITADMEEPPESILYLIEQWEKGYEIIWGIREHRKQGSLLNRIGSGLYHTLFRWLGVAQFMPNDVGGGLFMVDRRVVRALHQVQERNRSVIGLLMWLGFRQTTISYKQQPRVGRRSRWTLTKKIKLAIDSFTAFSYTPIRAVSLLGITISGLSLLYASGIIISSLVSEVSVQGWPTLMVTILFLGGLQFLITGMMGEYLWRALDEARQRPLYIIADSIGLNEEGGSESLHVKQTGAEDTRSD